jgi:RNA polymerase sigma factor (sigma-70 family)
VVPVTISAAPEIHEVTDLVARAARRETDAWNALHDRFQRSIVAASRAQGLTEADSADVAQETWLVLLEHVEDIRCPEALVGWLTTTARRRSIRHRQRSRRELPLEECLDVRGECPDVDALLDAERRAQALRRAVASLPARERALITALMDPTELSYRQIAERLSIPHGSIGPTRQRALRRLRALLEAEGITAYDGASAA